MVPQSNSINVETHNAEVVDSKLEPTIYNENTIVEEGSGKPSNKNHFP